MLLVVNEENEKQKKKKKKNEKKRRVKKTKCGRSQRMIFDLFLPVSWLVLLFSCWIKERFMQSVVLFLFPQTLPSCFLGPDQEGLVFGFWLCFLIKKKREETDQRES